MRTLVMISLLSAICVCAGAQEQKAANPERGQVTIVQQAYTFIINSPDAADQQKQRVFVAPEWLPGLSLDLEKPRRFAIADDQLTFLMDGAGCLKMRTYIVKRESKGSDTTTPAGYTECTPARRVQMKNAVSEQGTDQ